MSLFGVFAVLLSVTALLAWVNERFLRLPPTIGVMTAALCFSLLLLLLGRMGLVVDRWAEELFREIDFSALLMNGMLSFLLFAGALHVDLGALLQRKWSILTMATLGVVLSTLLLGTGAWLLFGWLGLSVPYLWALIFGALISPTDPIAVLSILRGAGAPENLRTMVIGESLFNDGVGVVVFSLILSLLAPDHGHGVGVAAVAELFAVEALGGVVFGLLLGWVAYRLLRTVDNFSVEILITLALVSGGYALAAALHTSGPIAMVVAGLFIGNHGRVFGMSDRSRDHLDGFWEVVDEILNAVLFVIIGFEVLLLDLEGAYLVAALAVIPLVLAVRLICVALPIALLSTFRTFDRGTVTLMTWGGIRGGISIALALALPAGAPRDLILVVTYAVVLFSILVQGLSLGRVSRWATGSAAS